MKENILNYRLTEEILINEKRTLSKKIKKQKEKFVEWLLKDITLGYSITNNTMTNSRIEHSSIFIKTVGNIQLNEVDLPDGLEIVIRKKLKNNSDHE